MKNILEQIISGSHPEPEAALLELLYSGELTKEEFMQLSIPPKLKTLVLNQFMLREVLTISEAAEMWGLDTSTLRRVFEGPRFKQPYDCRKSKGTWLVTKEAMERIYGEAKIVKIYGDLNNDGVEAYVKNATVYVADSQETEEIGPDTPENRKIAEDRCKELIEVWERERQ